MAVPKCPADEVKQKVIEAYWKHEFPEPPKNSINPQHDSHPNINLILPSLKYKS